MVLGDEDHERFTEDHYYVENSSRMPLILTFAMMLIFTLVWVYSVLPETLQFGP